MTIPNVNLQKHNLTQTSRKRASREIKKGVGRGIKGGEMIEPEWTPHVLKTHWPKEEDPCKLKR
jgi:hypothetical protein